jgi:hypothetical protein
MVTNVTWNLQIEQAVQHYLSNGIESRTRRRFDNRERTGMFAREEPETTRGSRKLRTSCFKLFIMWYLAHQAQENDRIRECSVDRRRCMNGIKFQRET